MFRRKKTTGELNLDPSVHIVLLHTEHSLHGLLANNQRVRKCNSHSANTVVIKRPSVYKQEHPERNSLRDTCSAQVCKLRPEYDYRTAE